MDTLPRHWHSTAAEQRDCEVAELRARLAAAENRVAAERHRAARMSRALQSAFIDQLKPRVPERLENSVEGIADCLVDEVDNGVAYDDLDVPGHIESWAEERS
jgi:hypothetical protein